MLLLTNKKKFLEDETRCKVGAGSYIKLQLIVFIKANENIL